MSHLFFFILSGCIFLALPASSQIKWDGDGGDNRWNNPLNWSGNTLPAEGTDVILDHSIVLYRYIVTLPEELVTVKSILINPGEGDTIELVLPPENLTVPALVVTGVEYGLTINRAGIFRNSSGAPSGISVSISDSIRINNGGRYVHNTPGGHAANVQVLSAAPGTEQGIMEFDIPDASTTLSFSGRTYGKLVLRAVAAGGTLNYTAAGTRSVQVRGDMEIHEGVNFNLNFADTINIHGDFIQYGGILNLGNTARNVVFAVEGNFFQGNAGTITESGTGNPLLLFSGDNQTVDLQGELLEEVTIERNGAGNAILLSPLSIGFCLSLKKGGLVTSAQSLITLLPGGMVEADISGVGYVDGPLRKEGLVNEEFLFPVGKENQLRWISLYNATGNFTVEYHKADPYSISGMIGEGLDHVSHIEYWDISPDDHSSAEAMVKLSFADPHSGGVTNMEDLRAARLLNGVWENAGNAGYEGTPGAAGWVSSNAASGFSAENNFFALASAIGQENPLPISTIAFAARRINESTILNWKNPIDIPVDKFELQVSADNEHYSTIHHVKAVPGRVSYRYEHHLEGPGTFYYRIRTVKVNGLGFYLSKTVRIISGYSMEYVVQSASLINNLLYLKLNSKKSLPINLILYNSIGIALEKFSLNVPAGIVSFEIPVNDLPRGIYYLSETDGYGMIKTHKLIKRF